MKTTFLLLLSIALFANSIVAAPKIGEPAPAFQGINAYENVVALSDFEGKYVVLEWLNYGCPFVDKHYVSGNMQGLQQKVTEDGGVWLSVVSSVKGKQGYMTPGYAIVKQESIGSKATHVILDTDGKIGRLYSARTTPHMFIISPEGTLIYQGAIDSISSANPKDVSRAENYVLKAWGNIQNGEPVETPVARPYGCSVKY